MKTRTRYKLTIEDESRLENVVLFSASPVKWTLIVLLALLCIIGIGALLVSLSPARYLLPGYLKESERAATQMQLLRLDSLRNAYETNVAFLDNLKNVLNPNPTPIDTSALSSLTTPLSADSLLPTSKAEENFVAMMREREKYNISVLAPLAAESLMFSPVNEESVFTATSRTATRGEIILAKGSPVAAVADGTVIAVTQSVRDGGSAVIIQHRKGFLSRLSRLGSILVEAGDVVTGGQIIALSNRGNAIRGEHIFVEMWHNGTSLVPYDYIGDSHSQTVAAPVIDLDVGRGRL
jgi:hypothetical protein